MPPISQSLARYLAKQFPKELGRERYKLQPVFVRIHFAISMSICTVDDVITESW